MSTSGFSIAIICTLVSSVIAYENAYDLLERRNRRLYQPRAFHPYREPNRYFTGNGNLHFSPFGNGYDNLGNGIRVRPFRHFANRWRPFPEAFDFPDYSRNFISHRPSEYYPVFHGTHPSYVGWGTSGVERFVGETEGKDQKKTDEIYQKSREGVKMDSVRKEKSGEALQSDQVEENKSSVRSNKVVKKGRTTKGFAVHHHKDETGNSTTFFDESSDFGGQSDLRDFADGFGVKKTLEQIIDKDDEKSFQETGGQHGSYGTGLLSGSQKSGKSFASSGSEEDSGGKFNGGNGNDNFEIRKSYRFLNGDPFDYTETDVDNFY